MAKDPIIFAMANPTPEIMPDEALAAGAAVVGTGRSDFPNQINNVLAFPGIFRGALDVRASDINDAMKIAAAKAIADFVTDEKLSAEYIIPSCAGRGCQRRCCKGSCTGCQGHRRSQSVTSDSTKRKSWDRGYCGLLSFFVDNVKSN